MNFKFNKKPLTKKWVKKALKKHDLLSHYLDKIMKFNKKPSKKFNK